MPQSLAHVIIHLVFSTKNRHPWLVKPIRERSHAYLATLAREMNCDGYSGDHCATHSGPSSASHFGGHCATLR